RACIPGVVASAPGGGCTGAIQSAWSFSASRSPASPPRPPPLYVTRPRSTPIRETAGFQLLRLPPKAVAQKAPDHRRGLVVDVDRVANRGRPIARRLHPMTDLRRGPHETNDVRRQDERGADDGALAVRGPRRGQSNLRRLPRQPMT